MLLSMSAYAFRPANPVRDISYETGRFVEDAALEIVATVEGFERMPLSIRSQKQANVCTRQHE
jgi:hypothetical protein